MFEILVLLILIILWFFIWSYIEKKHFKSIQLRENELNSIYVLSKRDLKKFSSEWSELFVWSVVVSTDFFKKFVAWIIWFFWWNLFVYESLLDRARREAILRLKQNIKDNWFNSIVNLRIETSSISKWKKNKFVWTVEVLAYWTWVLINETNN